MTAVMDPRDCSEFEIAVICALKLEAQCVCDALDRILDHKYPQAPSDDNAYTFGVMGEHNIVLVYLSGTGTNRAASAASDLKTSFRNIKLVLVVGICGGMPYGPDNEDIFLGDVVISKALIQYDYGKQHPSGFERNPDVLNTFGPLSDRILSLQGKLSMRQHMEIMRKNTSNFLKAIQRKSTKVRYPGSENDILYDSSYTHQHRSSGTCEECGKRHEICKNAMEMDCEKLGCEPVDRIRRQRAANSETTEPRIYFGTMGSANTVMKSGQHRETLARNEGITAVEMEAAGMLRRFSTIIIKGVSDYADSHKKDGWQWYAAAAAAAALKAFLVEWPSEGMEVTAGCPFKRELFDPNAEGHFWEHLTISCFDLYQQIWDVLTAQYGECLTLDGLVNGLKTARIIPVTADGLYDVEQLIRRNWTILLQASMNYSKVSKAGFQYATVKFPENLIFGLLYMTHVNYCFPNETPNSLEDPAVVISKKRWRSLTRFNRWCDCACKDQDGRDCGRLWNFMRREPFSRSKLTHAESIISGQASCLALTTDMMELNKKQFLLEDKQVPVFENCEQGKTS